MMPDKKRIGNQKYHSDLGFSDHCLVRISAEIHWALKLAAAERGISMKEVVEEAVGRWIKSEEEKTKAVEGAA